MRNLIGIIYAGGIPSIPRFIPQGGLTDRGYPLPLNFARLNRCKVEATLNGDRVVSIIHNGRVMEVGQ